jgi:antitoxin CcdA
MEMPIHSRRFVAIVRFEQREKLMGNTTRQTAETQKRTTDSSISEGWVNENRDALNSSNEYVEKHGLPLANFRQF